LGIDGEAAAAEWYQRHGYEVVARNWRCRDGELDLVLRHGRELVFCEVKTRSSDAFGTPAEAVDWRKQRRIHRLAARWLAECCTAVPSGIRFDVAAVLLAAGGLTIEVIEGAF
jgi:putative endonuclease